MKLIVTLECWPLTVMHRMGGMRQNGNLLEIRVIHVKRVILGYFGLFWFILVYFGLFRFIFGYFGSFFFLKKAVLTILSDFRF